jgi:hypothetical protein
MIVELFIPLLAAGAVFLEEITTGLRVGSWVKAASAIYLLIVGMLNVSFSLPVIPADHLSDVIDSYKYLYAPLREFKGGSNNPPIFLSGRIGWEELTRDVAHVYNALPPEDRAVAGIYADVYPIAGAIDQFGPQYGLPHAVSESLTYYFWGPGYSWDVMIVISDRINNMSVFFDKCEQKAVTQREYVGRLHFYIFVCRDVKVPVNKIWTRVRYLQ